MNKNGPGVFFVIASAISFSEGELLMAESLIIFFVPNIPLCYFVQEGLDPLGTLFAIVKYKRSFGANLNLICLQMIPLKAPDRLSKDLLISSSSIYR